MVEMAIQDDHLSARQSIGPTSTGESTQLRTPNWLSKTAAKTRVEAAIGVMYGRRTATRRKVRARSLRLSRLASRRASRSWGMLASRKMPTVFSSAFHQSLSVSSRR